MKKFLILFWIFFVIPAIALTDEEIENSLDDSSSIEESIDQEGGNLEINGYLLGRFGSTISKQNGDNEIVENDLKLQLKFKHKVADQAAFFASFDIYYNNLNTDESTNPFLGDTNSLNSYNELYNRKNHGFKGSIREAYVDFFTGFADFRFGNQIIKWGAADSPSAQFNPNSMVSPANLDSSFLLQDEDLVVPVTAFKMELNLGPVVIEGICLPVFTKTEMADQQGFWGITSGTIIIVNSTTYLINGRTIDNKYPSATLSNVDGGGRVGFTILNSDLNFYYMFRRESIPQFLQTYTLTTGPNTAQVANSVIYPRTHNVGYSMRGEIKLLEIAYRGDINYIFNKEMLSSNFDDSLNPVLVQQSVKKNQISYNVGIDYTIPFFGVDFQLDFYEKRILSENGEIAGYKNQGFLIPRLEDDFMNNRLFLRASGIWDIRENTIYVKPEIEYRPSADSQLIVGVLYFATDKKEIKSSLDINVSAFAGNDMLYARAKYSF